MGFLIWLALMVFFYTFAQPIFWVLVAIEVVVVGFVIIAYVFSALFRSVSWFADTVLSVHRIRMRYEPKERRYKFYLA